MIFVWKIGFDAACFLEYDLEVDERVEIVYAGLQTFCDDFILACLLMTSL